MTGMPPSDAVTVESHDDVVVARVHGDIDMSNVDMFTTSLRGAFNDQIRGLVVDLSEARFFDSSGLRTLFEVGEELQRRGGRMALALPSSVPLRRLLEISGAEAIASIEESVERGIKRVEA